MAAVRTAVGGAVLGVILSATPNLNAGQDQPEAAFDVASIKPNRSDERGARFNVAPSRFTLSNAPISVLVLAAYQLDDTFQSIGLPRWAVTERFDIVATSEGTNLTTGGDPSQLHMMLRRFLRDRFRFQGRIEEREVDVFELVRARPDGAQDPGLKPSTIDCDVICSTDPASARRPLRPGGPPQCGMIGSATSFAAGSISISQFVSLVLAPRTGRPVLDRTQLTGTYEVSLTFSIDEQFTTPLPSRENQDQDAPSIFTAIDEQLGLKLVPSRGTARFLVVENIEPPTPD